MKKLGSLKLILFFALLTLILTWLVIFAWETILRDPFYTWVEVNFRGEDTQWKIQQRVEHFFISTTVDVVVVTLLLRLVNRQQRQLRESEERYRALFEHANDGIGVIRANDHLLIDVNKKFGDILGYPQQSLIGAHVCKLFDGHTGGANHALLEGVFICAGPDANPEGKPWAKEAEINVKTVDGVPVVLFASCSSLVTEKEKLFILIIRDVTVRRRLEHEKQEMERQLFQTSKLASIGELSAGVAHEINNPLNALVNFAQLLKDDEVARNDSERRMIDGIIDEGERIAKIVRNLLIFARQDPHLPTQVAIAPVIENSLSMFGHQLQKDGIAVEVEIADDLWPVRADASRLRQVIVNMISNARQALSATDSDHKVFRITARNVERAGERKVIIEFFDNGHGISRENIDKVFDPFFTTRRDSGGTGLGLSLSFGIIHDYGGTITVESEEGRFARFIVELPSDKLLEGEYAESFAGGRRAKHPLDDERTA
jgi:PAS domain S-box-containing protein